MINYFHASLNSESTVVVLKKRLHLLDFLLRVKFNVNAKAVGDTDCEKAILKLCRLSDGLAAIAHFNYV